LLIEDLEQEFSSSLQVEANPFSAEAVLRRTLRNAQAGSLEELPVHLTARTIEIVYDENETLEAALERIRQEAREAVAAGVSLLILDDASAY
ncbi:glutamate synthase central domain-containing protein, partial [Salmonella sp. SAL4450]|uniref:glutamate synthase central domain-containing protein n=1 Tax=Salmonella sp. SAL4450 TaxID=3159905 RepID=UPI00397D2B4E